MPRDWLDCDNFKTCNGTIPASDSWVETENRARTKGWHIYHGFSETGKRIDVTLCPVCVGPTRRLSALGSGREPLEGQLNMFEQLDQ
jgi:hypothetical protein